MTTPVYRFPTQTEIAAYLREKIKNPWYDNNNIIHRVSQIFANKMVNEMGITIVLTVGLFEVIKRIDPTLQPEDFVPIERLLKEALIGCSMLTARL